MRELKYLSLALVMGLAFCPLLAGQQPSRRATSVPDLFNQEAAASDPAGIHKYNRDLIDLVLPNQWTYGRSPSRRMEMFEDERLGEDYAAKLADRLARAEQMARTGKGKLVAEADIVRAFNELMVKIGAPSLLRDDEVSMRKFREHAASIKAFTALFSADRNGTNCYPGEAVFLLYLLLYNNGHISEAFLNETESLKRLDEQGGGSGAMSIRIVKLNQGAKGLLLDYSTHHHRRATITLFNNIAKTLDF